MVLKVLKTRFVGFFLAMASVMVISAMTASAQDLIVSTKGDSINCKIMVQNLKSVHFFYKDGGVVVTKELPRTAIKSLVVGYYEKGKASPPPPARTYPAPVSTQQVFTEQLTPSPSALPPSAPPPVVSAPIEPQTSPDTIVRDSLSSAHTESRLLDTVVISTKVHEYSRWYIGLKGGYSSRLFRVNQSAPTPLKDYLGELKSGYTIGAGAGYFFWKKVALGVIAESYRSSATMPDDTRDDKVGIGFVGIHATHRRVLRNDKSAVYSGFNLGYQSYFNERRELGELEIFKGKALGWGVNLGVDYAISPHVALSFTASCLSGTLYNLSRQSNGKTDRIKLNPDNYEDLARFSLTIGLRFL